GFLTSLRVTSARISDSTQAKAGNEFSITRGQRRPKQHNLKQKETTTMKTKVTKIIMSSLAIVCASVCLLAAMTLSTYSTAQAAQASLCTSEQVHSSFRSPRPAVAPATVLDYACEHPLPTPRSSDLNFLTSFRVTSARISDSTQAKATNEFSMKRHQRRPK